MNSHEETETDTDGQRFFWNGKLTAEDRQRLRALGEIQSSEDSADGKYWIANSPKNL